MELSFRMGGLRARRLGLDQNFLQVCFGFTLIIFLFYYIVAHVSINQSGRNPPPPPTYRPQRLFFLGHLKQSNLPEELLTIVYTTLI